MAYGFPELKNTVSAPEGQWVVVFQEATRIILASLKIHNRVPIIREAVRFICEEFGRNLEAALLNSLLAGTRGFQKHRCPHRRSRSATSRNTDRLSGERIDGFGAGGLLAFHRHAGSSIQGTCVSGLHSGS